MMDAVTRRADSYSIRWRSLSGAIADELWSACFPPPLEGLWWYAALERSGLQSQFSFAYAVIEKNRRPVGIAPCFLMDLALGMVPNRTAKRILDFASGYFSSLRSLRILFVGSPCSAEGTIGLMPDCRLADAMPALVRALRLYAARSGARAIVFKDLPASYTGVFDSWCVPGGLVKVVSYPGTTLSLKGEGFDRYLRSLNASHRYKVRRKIARSKERVELRGEIVRHPGAGVVDDIFALYRQTYAKSAVKFERLTLDFFRAIAEEDCAYFVFLRESGTAKLVAFMLCLRLGPRVINKFVGLDYASVDGAFVYFRLYEHAIDWASRAGASEFYSGQNGYSAKLDLGHALVPLTNYFAHLNPLWHRLLSQVARNITWSRLDTDLKAYVSAHAREVSAGNLTPASILGRHKAP